MASIEKRSRNGLNRWRVVWREDGQKQQRTFKIEDAAQRFLAKVKAYGDHWPPGEDPRTGRRVESVTFGEWAVKAIGRRSLANERTKTDYLRDVDRHMKPLLPLALDEVTADDVIGWMAGLTEAKLSAKTIGNLHGLASSVMADALSQYPPLVTHNPFANRFHRSARVRTEEMVMLTPQEFGTLLGYVRPEYAALIRLLAGTGLRYGEATALTVGDVDLLGRRKTLTVTKAWKRTGPSQYAVGEPKTARSRRTLVLSSELIELLIPVVSARNSGELLFPCAGGGRLPHIEVYKRGWSPAVARANVCDACYEPQRDGRRNRPTLPKACEHGLGKAPRIHDLRHSHVSWLIAEGIGLPVISRRLGHSSITITMDRYGHLDPSLDDSVNAAVDRALAATGFAVAADIPFEG